MSAIKDKIAWYEFLVKTNREKGIVDASIERDLEVTKEISDRLDALEKKAHEPLPPMRVYDIPVDADGTFHPDKATLEAVHYFDTERSCMKCRSYNGCQATAEELGSALPEKGCADYEPKPDTEPSCDEPAQEHGGDDGVDYRAEWYKSLERESDLRARLEKYESEEQGGDDVKDAMIKGLRDAAIDLRARLEQAEAKVKELTAELEKQKASAFETGELALKRGFEIERLEKENAELKRIAGIAIENWSSWVHDQLDGTLGLKDAIYEVDELKRQLNSEVKP